MRVDVTKILEKYADIVADQMKEILIKHNKKASGNFINSITYKISDKEIVFSGDSYGEYILNGRKAGKQPPLQPIINWLRVKKFSIGNGKYRSMIKKGKRGNTEAQIKSKAYVIARSIGKKGTKGVDFTTPIKQANVKLLEEVRQYYIDKIKMVWENKK